MSVLSVEYLVFTAAVVLLYYLFPLRKRFLVLLAASALFCLMGGLSGAAYLAAIVLCTWGGALMIRLFSGKTAAAGMMLAAVLILTLGGMVFFKYGEAVAGLLGQAGWLETQQTWDLILPLGLSWFTFQGAGYVIDVYWGKAEPVRNPFRYFLFLGFFPQLTQGPVSSFRELNPQLQEGRRLDPETVTFGFLLMLWGYFKKLVIADRMAAITVFVTSSETLPAWMAWFGAAAYMIRLYADFSGGMDVIRGTAYLFGIELTENFRRPFFADSVAEYWRRWHISLGAWFRTYLLYPFTTSRAGRAVGRCSVRLLGKKTGRLVPSVIATVLIFFLIGIWHSASLNAVFYGLYFGVLMSISMLAEPAFGRIRKRFGRPKGNLLPKPLGLIRTWLLLTFAQFFAFSEDSAQAFSLIRQAFLFRETGDPGELLLSCMAPLEWGILGAGLAVLLAVDLLEEHGFQTGKKLVRGSILIRWPVLLALILVTVVFGCYGDGSGGAAFLYTQF